MNSFIELIQYIRRDIVASIKYAVLPVLLFLAYLFRDVLRDILFYRYKQFQERNSDSDDTQADEWYQDTLTMARQVQRFWESKYVEPKERGENFSFEEVQAEFGLLADQLDRHATRNQDDIPPEVVNLVYEVAQECRSVENELISVGPNEEFQKKGKSAVEKAEKLEEAAKHRL